MFNQGMGGTNNEKNNYLNYDLINRIHASIQTIIFNDNNMLYNIRKKG